MLIKLQTTHNIFLPNNKMQATRRRLREVTELLAQTNDRSASYYPLKEEERFITRMLAVEERIAVIERGLADEKTSREDACNKLVDLGIGISAIAATRAAVETSTSKTVELTIQLTLQQDEKDKLIRTRTLEMTMDSTSNRSAFVF
jgi:hypothetical protein